MAVLINELEVVVEPPSAPAGEAPPEPVAAATETPPPVALSPGDLRAVICHLTARAERVRAH